MLLVVRHADGTKGSWDGPDMLRPLSPLGVSKLRGWWSAWRTTRSRILCSPTLRCHQTVQPLADRLLPIEDVAASGWTPVPARVGAVLGSGTPGCGAVHPWRDDRAAARAGWSPTGRRGAAGLAQGLDLAAAARQPATGPRPLSGPVGLGGRVEIG